MHKVVTDLHETLLNVADPFKRETAEGWTVIQLVGHLIDSAANNHQRFVRYTPSEPLHFPAYPQEQCVERGHYLTIDYQALVALWYNYNLLIAHIIENILADDRAAVIVIGDNPPVTLGFVIDDYYDHMQMHAGQFERILEA